MNQTAWEAYADSKRTIEALFCLSERFHKAGLMIAPKSMTFQFQVEDSVSILFRRLECDGILIGAPKVTPPSVPNPAGDLMIDLHVPAEQRDAKIHEAETLSKVLLTDIDLHWLPTFGEGWAAPLQGFMREGTLLETLHFNSILVDPFNITGNKNRLETMTDLDHYPEHPPNQRGVTGREKRLGRIRSVGKTIG